MIQGVIMIESLNSKKWMASDLALVVEIQKNGSAGNLHLLSTQAEQNIGNFEPHPRAWRYNDEEWEELQSFNQNIPFTVGKLETGFDLLKKTQDSKKDTELSITILSTSPIMIVETGELATNLSELPIPLYPKDR